jgi:uncharacterized protein YndB with AHSA1/START domain
MVAKNNSTREVVVSHVFKARREVVFKAWTDPKLLAQWWAPHGFTTPLCEVDVRPGGKIRVDMRGPDGTVYPMTGVYQEVVVPERLVFITRPLNAEGEMMFEVLNTATFVEKGRHTEVTLHALVLKSTREADGHLQGMEMGWRQSLERLATLTEGKSS